jgi:hypothetical protein
MEQGYNNMAKNWCMTINNYHDDVVERFNWELKPMAVYYIYGYEIGGNGTPHLQCFFSLKQKKRMATLKKIFPTAHFEVKSKKSTMAEASDYCKKDGTFVEWGVLPDDGTKAGLKVIAENYEETVELAKAGKMDEIGAEHLLKYYNTIKKIAHDHKKMPENLDWVVPPNIWIWGPTGTGKSYRAREILGEGFYTKIAANKWWDKYDNEDGVLIEDMDVTHSYMGYYLKIWADKYAFAVEVKCSADLIRPKVIIVTSNYPIEQVFPDRSIHDPLKRRFKVIHMEQAWNATLNDALVREATWNGSDEGKEKKRKFDQPLPRPTLLRRDAKGDLVPWTQTQRVMDEFIEDPRAGVNEVHEESSDDLMEI